MKIDWKLIRLWLFLIAGIVFAVVILRSCYDVVVHPYNPSCPAGMFYSYVERACIPGVRP